MLKHEMLIKLRKQKRLSQTKLAMVIGVSRQTVINIENGEFPSLETAKKLEDFFSQELYNVGDNGKLRIQKKPDSVQCQRDDIAGKAS